MTTNNKLRRQRKFGGEGSIQSQLPNTDVPHSRRYTGRGRWLPASGVLKAPDSGLTLNNVANRIICGNAVSVLRQLPDDWCSISITSPSYWHTVDCGVKGQIGLDSYNLVGDRASLVAQRKILSERTYSPAR